VEGDRIRLFSAASLVGTGRLVDLGVLLVKIVALGSASQI
jgi:hypothetical protein